MHFSSYVVGGINHIKAFVPISLPRDPFIIVTCNCNWIVSLLSALVPPIITRTQIGSFFVVFVSCFLALARLFI